MSTVVMGVTRLTSALRTGRSAARPTEADRVFLRIQSRSGLSAFPQLVCLDGCGGRCPGNQELPRQALRVGRAGSAAEYTEKVTDASISARPIDLASFEEIM